MQWRSGHNKMLEIRWLWKQPEEEESKPSMTVYIVQRFNVHHLTVHSFKITFLVCLFVFTLITSKAHSTIFCNILVRPLKAIRTVKKKETGFKTHKKTNDGLLSGRKTRKIRNKLLLDHHFFKKSLTHKIALGRWKKLQYWIDSVDSVYSINLQNKVHPVPYISSSISSSTYRSQN